MRPHTDDADIIGTKPKQDLGPLFAHCEPAEAEAEIRRDFLEPEKYEAVADGGFVMRTDLAREMFDVDRLEARETIKRIVGPRLLARAEARRDARSNPGITADDVRDLAKAVGLDHALGGEQRAWSWVAGWLKQFVKAGELVEYRVDGQLMRRASTREESHGNPQAIYLSPRDYRAQVAA